MLNKIRTAILSLGIISTALLSHPVLANDAVGYCKLHTTLGWIGKGKCKIYTQYDNESHSIAVTIREPWPGGNKHLFILLRDNPRCRHWDAFSNSCPAKVFYEETNELGPLPSFTVGNGGFGYSFGHGYVVEYEGVFPQPSTDNYSGRD